MKNVMIDLLKQDYSRYSDESWSISNCLRYMKRCPGFDFMVWFRLTNSTKSIVRKGCAFMLRSKSMRYGFDIPFDTKIGGGCCIRHFGLVIINHKCSIGENFTVVPGTVIGKSKGAVPTIGNNVSIGANSSVIGEITIGDNAVIGAGSVVVHNVDVNAVVAGNPAKNLT